MLGVYDMVLGGAGRGNSGADAGCQIPSHPRPNPALIYGVSKNMLGPMLGSLYEGSHDFRKTPI